jgi:hypothetical protein
MRLAELCQRRKFYSAVSDLDPHGKVGTVAVVIHHFDQLLMAR